ncbi:rerric reductase like transmembrane component [Penicillium cataractarum]|uniref:ferric-chelate reductase (NADPH) n=1 Tax=Penicillium cataractarum TaxID=2100454 RepID=A0A9W9V851_9EURO|nr:rerric reductase like transmembrane component [Penicillium cataractarum]KAJ5369940.1 rerric reductase like transmembrane component [Penicillium cataractarum]
MDLLLYYAILVGGFFTTLILIRIASHLKDPANSLSVFVSKHLIYPNLVGRHQLCGPWSRAQVLLCLLYIVINFFFLTFRVSTVMIAGRRAGTLSVINMGLLFPTTHLSFFADMLGISQIACRQIHRFVGWLALVLLSFHITVAMAKQGQTWSLRDEENLFAVVGATSMAGIALLSIPFARRSFFEIYLRAHQAFAAVCIYSTWRHLPSEALNPRIYIYVPLGFLASTTLLYIALLVFRNGIFPPRQYPRASITCDRVKQPSTFHGNEGTTLKIRVVLSRPLQVKAGQYIYLWMPTVSLCSWAQVHPFMVTSWSPERQDVLELFVQVRQGLTKILHSRAALDGFASYTAIVSGPHGVSQSVSEYECVLAIATDFGIAGVIPYLKQLFYGYNTSTSHVRRVHFVWQVQNIDIAISAEPLLNSLLSDDVLDEGYILEMSFYVASEEAIGGGKPFGNHGRAVVFNGVPKYEEIVSEEASGSRIQRLPDTPEEQGKTLLLVRDNLREIVCGHLSKKLSMLETHFQPVP